jgi:fructokinase
MSSSADRFVAVGLGEVLWDLLPQGKQLGGAPANFAYHAHQLGATSSIASSVGRDMTGIGHELLVRLRDLRLSTELAQIDAKHPTGTVSVELDAAGVPTYIIHQNVAWDFIRQTPELLDRATRTDVVCFGSLAQRCQTSRSTIRAFLGRMRPESLRIFDINLRQKFYDADIVAQSLELANVLKLNDQELPVVCDLLKLPADPKSAIAKLIDTFDLRLLALTRGDKGSLLATKSQTSEHRGIRPEKLADTVGAGDAFTAAVAIGLLLNRSLEEINEVANRLASYVCTQAGATPPVPTEFRYR